MSDYMKYAKCYIWVFFLFFFFWIIPKEAYAYLDLGSGSFIFQLIIGALLGMCFAIKVHWIRIKQFFSKHFSRRDKKV